MIVPSIATFARFGPDRPATPVILSVPHAGRVYPAGFEAVARLTPSQLGTLEDRFADLLVARAVDNGVPAIVARTARAWVDLNRSEREFDPGLMTGGHASAPIASVKVRGGLGVVPRRLNRLGEIWRRPLGADEFARRIDEHHRPYHAALAGLIGQALERFGVAVLLDIHSMPPLTAAQVPHARYIVGDLFGRAAHGRFTQAALSVLGDDGSAAALNSPYAGGYVLERHGMPRRNVHALQIEVDRSLYLDAELDRPSAGLEAIQSRVADLTTTMAAEALAGPLAVAAE